MSGRARAKRRGPEKALKKRPRRLSLKELDKACRAYIFERDGRKCRKCGKANVKLDWAHVYSRRYKTTRWHPWGSMCLCAGCHFWWHQNPLEAMRWFETEFGPLVVESLLEAKRRPKPPSPDETLAALA